MTTVSFDALYTMHASMVYWAAFGVSNNHDTALETMQLVFLRAYENWALLQDLGGPQVKSWLYRTARNAAIDRLRKDRREFLPETMPECTDSNADSQPEAACLRLDEEERMFARVQALPARYRDAVVLYYFADLSQQEAADALGISAGTYRSRLARARTMLKKQWEREDTQHAQEK